MNFVPILVAAGTDQCYQFQIPESDFEQCKDPNMVKLLVEYAIANNLEPLPLSDQLNEFSTIQLTNLPYGTWDDEILSLVQEALQVNGLQSAANNAVKRCLTCDDFKSAQIEFISPTMAATAFSGLNGYEYRGHILVAKAIGEGTSKVHEPFAKLQAPVDNCEKRFIQIKNLPYGTWEDEVSALVSKVLGDSLEKNKDAIKSITIKSNFTTAEVHFSSDEYVAVAMGLNGNVFEGHIIRVEEKAMRPSFSTEFSRILFEELPFGFTEDELCELVLQAMNTHHGFNVERNDISNVEIFPNYTSGEVQFFRKEHTAAALALDGMEFDGLILHVQGVKNQSNLKKREESLNHHIFFRILFEDLPFGFTEDELQDIILHALQSKGTKASASDIREVQMNIDYTSGEVEFYSSHIAEAALNCNGVELRGIALKTSGVEMTSDKNNSMTPKSDEKASLVHYDSHFQNTSTPNKNSILEKDNFSTVENNLFCLDDNISVVSHDSCNSIGDTNFEVNHNSVEVIEDNSFSGLNKSLSFDEYSYHNERPTPSVRNEKSTSDAELVEKSTVINGLSSEKATIVFLSMCLRFKGSEKVFKGTTEAFSEISESLKEHNIITCVEECKSRRKGLDDYYRKQSKKNLSALMSWPYFKYISALRGESQLDRVEDSEILDHPLESSYPSDSFGLKAFGVERSSQFNENYSKFTKGAVMLHSAVLCLIDLVTVRKEEFDKPQRHASLWQQVSQEMVSRGHIFSPTQCKDKMDNLRKKFKDITDEGKKTGRGVIHWPYYDFLVPLLGDNVTVNPPKAVSVGFTNKIFLDEQGKENDGGRIRVGKTRPASCPRVLAERNVKSREDLSASIRDLIKAVKKPKLV